MSKISVAGVRNNVQQLLEHSTKEKKRNFLETVHLPLTLYLLVLMTDYMIGRTANRSKELRSPAR